MDYENLSQEELYTIINECGVELEQRKLCKIQSAVRANQSYVGKAYLYQPLNLYFLVTSPLGANEYRLGGIEFVLDAVPRSEIKFGMTVKNSAERKLPTKVTYVGLRYNTRPLHQLQNISPFTKPCNTNGWKEITQEKFWLAFEEWGKTIVENVEEGKFDLSKDILNSNIKGEWLTDEE